LALLHGFVRDIFDGQKNHIRLTIPRRNLPLLVYSVKSHPFSKDEWKEEERMEDLNKEDGGAPFSHQKGEQRPGP
jgi:hypothetical protein